MNVGENPPAQSNPTVKNPLTVQLPRNPRRFNNDSQREDRSGYSERISEMTKYKFGDYTLSRDQILTIAEYVAMSDDFVWDEFTEQERISFAESFVLPIPDAIKSLGFKISRSNTDAV